MQNEKTMRPGVAGRVRDAVEGLVQARQDTDAHERLGAPLRACQLYFVALLAGALAYALATNPVDFAYDFSLVHTFVLVALAGVAVWLFYPLMDKGLRRLPRSVSDGLFFALLSVYAFSALLHFMHIDATGLIVGDFVMKPE